MTRKMAPREELMPGSSDSLSIVNGTLETISTSLLIPGQTRHQPERITARLRRKAKGKNIDSPFSQNFLLKKQEVEALLRREIAFD
jgi:hypothetical protein